MWPLGVRKTSEAAEEIVRRPSTTGRRAVLLIHPGVPEGPDAGSVRGYVSTVLGDREVVQKPYGLAWLRSVSSRVLSTFNVHRLASVHQSAWAGGCSRTKAIIEKQASALASELPRGFRVFQAFQYGRPGISEVVGQLSALGIEELVVVPMYPQCCGAATQSAIHELYQQIDRVGYRFDVTLRGIWYDDAGYINALAWRIREYADAHRLTPENAHLVYTVPSPSKPCTGGRDVGGCRVRRTVELVTSRLGWPAEQTSLGFEGWTELERDQKPTAAEVLAGLLRAGERHVLVCPLGFTTGSSELWSQEQARLRHQFEEAGGRFHSCPALDMSEPFIAVLKNLVLRGRRPASSHASGAHSSSVDAAFAVTATEEHVPIDSLVMVGMSLAGRLGCGRGPDVVNADEGEFRRIKDSQSDVPDILRSVCGRGAVREGLLWNTCRRFEFYGWLHGAGENGNRAGAASSICRRLFNGKGDAESSAITVLHGSAAWHHLLRTAAGLNSGLPGEREVLEQLDAARRVAERAGTAGPLLNGLVSAISDSERRLRAQTPWGRFQPDYCAASLARIAWSTDLDLHTCRCVVIGGSTTSCGVLKVLGQRFGVPARQLTLLHRGHGHCGQLKVLRKAIGGGRRIRVNRYDEEAVIREIAGADAVFFGIDSRAPVLRAQDIRGRRDFSERPLAMIDFNTFGSTVGMEELVGVQLWDAETLENAVAEYAEIMCRHDSFALAADSAESWIRDHVPSTIMPAASQR